MVYIVNEWWIMASNGNSRIMPLGKVNHCPKGKMFANSNFWSQIRIEWQDSSQTHWTYSLLATLVPSRNSCPMDLSKMMGTIGHPKTTILISQWPSMAINGLKTSKNTVQSWDCLQLQNNSVGQCHWGPSRPITDARAAASLSFSTWASVSSWHRLEMARIHGKNI